MESIHTDAATTQSANDLDAEFTALMRDTETVHLEKGYSADPDGNEFDDLYSAFMEPGQAAHPVALGELFVLPTAGNDIALKDTYCWKLITDT